MQKINQVLAIRFSQAIIWALTINLTISSFAHAATSTPDPCTGGQPGVLIKCIYPNTDFFGYASAFLDQYQTAIITAAAVLIVASGVQYMLAMGKSDQQAKAKQRIVGVLVGIIFFTLIHAIIVLLNPAAQTIANPTEETSPPASS